MNAGWLWSLSFRLLRRFATWCGVFMLKLTATECRKFIDAVVKKAAAMGAPVSIAVIGPDGHIIAGRAHG
jgi:hypothetical protein